MVRQQGETTVYDFHHAAQNHDQERHLCANCGTTLFWFVSSLPDKIGIAGGCFDGEGLPEPTYAVSDAKRKTWVSLPSRSRVWTE